MTQDESQNHDEKDTFLSSLKDTMDKEEFMLSDGTDLSRFVDDDEDDPFADDSTTLKRFVYAVIVLVILGGFSVLAWYAYQFGSRPVDIDNLRLVQAETEPYKVKPDSPGGMDVPYRDKTIYDSISGSKKESKTAERLLPSPEEPVDLRKESYDEVVEKAKNAAAKLPVQKKKEAKKLVVLEEPERTHTKPINLKKTTERKTSAVKPVSKEDLKPAPKHMKDPIVPVSLDKKPKYRIQLGAYRTEKTAADEWRRIQRKFPKELGGLSYFVERKDLGAKGVFYRLQAGPLQNVSTGRSTCKKLIANKQGCFFVDTK